MYTNIYNKVYFSSFMTLYSLILISIGMGGIKSCIAAFGVDQLIENDKNISESHVCAFFSTFYFTIHLGVFFGMFTSPAITKIMAYGGYNINEYVVRFGLPAIMMTISISEKILRYLTIAEYLKKKNYGYSLKINANITQ